MFEAYDNFITCVQVLSSRNSLSGCKETYFIPLTGVTPEPASPVADDTTFSPMDAVVNPYGLVP